MISFSIGRKRTECLIVNLTLNKRLQKLTQLTLLLWRNCKAVFALLKKWGLLSLEPLSVGWKKGGKIVFIFSVRVNAEFNYFHYKNNIWITNFSPDNTSSSASNFVPSFKSSIKSFIRIGGFLCKIKEAYT